MNIKHFTLKIMDYKEKYEKALEKAKEYNNVYKDHTMMSYAKGALEEIFPELAESEDEKIRKWIINEIKIKHHNLDEENVDFVDKALAWLEKQNEQKPTNSYCQENCKGYQETGKCFADGMCNAKREAEQKPKEDKGNIGGISSNSEWSEEDEKMMAAIEHHLNNCGASITSILWLKSIKQK